MNKSPFSAEDVTSRKVERVFGFGELLRGSADTLLLHWLGPIRVVVRDDRARRNRHLCFGSRSSLIELLFIELITLPVGHYGDPDANQHGRENQHEDAAA